jgi:SHS2 domain-containing protein
MKSNEGKDRMEKYQFLLHTADAKFKAFGKTLEETFAHAALAVASLMWDWEKIVKSIEIPVAVRGKDLEQLLVNFLEEILYLSDTRDFLLGSVDNVLLEHKGDVWTLRALFKGDMNASGYEIFGDVKAITYNEMVIRNQPPYMVQVVADV